MPPDRRPFRFRLEASPGKDPLSHGGALDSSPDPELAGLDPELARLEAALGAAGGRGLAPPPAAVLVIGTLALGRDTLFPAVPVARAGAVSGAELLRDGTALALN